MSIQTVAQTEAIGGSASRRVLRRLGHTARLAQRQPLGTVGLLVCLVALAASVFAPWIQRYDMNAGSAVERLQSPSASHWFGTDDQGRDLFSRIVNGARVSLYVAFFSIALGTTSGYLLGVVSSYLGGWVDMILQRIMDTMLALPPILMALAMVAVLGAGVDKIIAAISIVYLPRAARISYGVVLSLKANVYVDAAKVIGASPMRIILRHVLPNALAPYIILASVSLGSAILLEASLSFLGLGVPPPHPSWGGMLAGATQRYALGAPWMVIAPGAAIMVLVMAFNFFGDALRDLGDPRLRGR
ncbi:MAG: ABC transporter permease [Dehalococcoidia bacterium]|nr:ABC transporter permease [Dehalococcoidia bacterium]